MQAIQFFQKKKNTLNLNFPILEIYFSVLVDGCQRVISDRLLRPTKLFI